jgi:general stress protein 26
MLISMSDASNFKNPNIADFLKRNHIAVLATVSKQTGAPHAAAVYYATDSQMNLFILTKDETTKSKNLDANPHAAIVIYEADTQRTAQINTLASRVEDPRMMEKALRIMAKYSKQTAQTEGTPISKLQAGDYVLYKLWPQTIRLAEYKYGGRNEIFETATPAEESLE